ncbi:succinyldiaminopimelate transaminase [Porticoccus sp. W117]|uniref:succinyldiaminopimelate transaminase n=1 Tax=Porticoccus sp. W117 TaxID=3054777 RepID=UPI002598C5F4|nr:succinyldiaminopimelate transaminase [Porticoccus sp. W117]MDM3872217.1 succinyldiaminopimelate transaminase [Porticoccus sp. W117]
MNPDLDKLQPYPFERLAALKQGVQPPTDCNPVTLSIGEPKHAAPEFVLQALTNSLAGLGNYPATKGSDELRNTISQWLCQRFQLQAIDPQQILPVNGTREALFAFAQAIVDRQQAAPLVVMPNPFYQIYEGAALLAGAEPYFLNCDPENRFIPDFDQVEESVWQRCQLLYICTPGNPTGAVLSLQQLQKLIELADTYDFVIASDECYSEIYLDENQPPVGLLQACAALGRHDYRRCVIFQSLSKRSNLPGLRSGFVAGDQTLIEKFLLYRTYHGCAMSLPVQQASIAAWNDEQHVVENRRLYREKFDAVLPILAGKLGVQKPEAGFFLWAKVPDCTPLNDQQFTRQLFANTGITVLPGSFLARNSAGGNPGERYLRIALVAPLEECRQAAQDIADFVDRMQVSLC